MKILYLCSEAAPFVKTGGLADVMYSLPKKMVELGPVSYTHLTLPTNREV